MPPKSSTSREYRATMDDEDDEDDLDDLDDVLANFNKPSSSRNPAQTPLPAAKSEAGPSRPVKAPALAVQDDDEDFEASLAEGMESLLRQLASQHPPGSMENAAAAASTPRDARISDTDDDGLLGGLTKEEEEEAWQKAIEMMLSGEGKKALGLDDGGPAPPLPASAGSLGSGPGAKPTFEETMRRTMESLQSPSHRSKAGSAEGMDAGLADLFAKLGTDPSALDGLGDDDGLGGILDGMMAQLMTKEVLEEPMAELASKYPAYLADPPDDVSPDALSKYRQQSAIVQKILDTFRRKDYSDEKDGKEVARLVGEMQDLGGPPKQIMGDLPEGLNLDALGGDENCTIM